MYVFTPKRGSPICHVLLTAQNTHRWVLLFIYNSRNSLDFYTNKTKLQLQTLNYCHLLGFEETLSVAYDLGEAQTCNYFFFTFRSRRHFAEILASVWQEVKNFEVQPSFSCVIEKL